MDPKPALPSKLSAIARLCFLGAASMLLLGAMLLFRAARFHANAQSAVATVLATKSLPSSKGSSYALTVQYADDSDHPRTAEIHTSGTHRPVGAQMVIWFDRRNPNRASLPGLVTVYLASAITLTLGIGLLLSGLVMRRAIKQLAIRQQERREKDGGPAVQ